MGAYKIKISRILLYSTRDKWRQSSTLWKVKFLMPGTHSWSLPGQLIPFLGLCHHGTQSSSPRISLAPLHSCCCSWWWSHGASISKKLGSPPQQGWLFSQASPGLSAGILTRLGGAKSQLLSMTPQSQSGCAFTNSLLRCHTPASLNDSLMSSKPVKLFTCDSVML